MIEKGVVEQAIDTATANNTATLHNINESIIELYEAAQSIKDQYLEAFMETSGRNGNKHGSRTPTIRPKDLNRDHPTLEIRWMRTITNPDPGGAPIRTSYKKGLGNGYSIKRITKGAPEWETRLITEAEQQFEEIRGMYLKLSKIRTLCTNLHKSLENRN